MIEVVKSYKHLEVIFTSSGSLGLHMAERLRAAKASIMCTWKNYLLNPKISIACKYKVFKSVSKSILCFAAEVWGWRSFEQVEKLQRCFIKFIFKLSQSTPNYMVLLEFGLHSMFLDTLSSNFEYICKVLDYEQSRLPNVLLKQIVLANCSWFKEWMRLADVAHFNLSLSLDNLQDLPKIIVSFLECLSEKENRENIQLVKNGKFHGVYNNLNYKAMNVFDYFTPIVKVSLIFKARGSLLGLNTDFNFDEKENVRCDLCNIDAPEDIIHLIDICPFYRDLRRKYLGQALLNTQKVIDHLNDKNYENLYRYLADATHRRAVLLNEIASQEPNLYTNTSTTANQKGDINQSSKVATTTAATNKFKSFNSNTGNTIGTGNTTNIDNLSGNGGIGGNNTRSIPPKLFNKRNEINNINIINKTINNDIDYTTTTTLDEAPAVASNFFKSYQKNSAKIRQHDPDVSPRPRRQYQNDPSSRYYNKSDGTGQGQQQQHQERLLSGENSAASVNRNLTSLEEGGGGGRYNRQPQQQYHQQYTRDRGDRQQYYRNNATGSPTEQLVGGVGGGRPPRLINNGNSFNAPRFENNRNNGGSPHRLGDYSSSSSSSSPSLQGNNNNNNREFGIERRGGGGGGIGGGRSTINSGEIDNREKNFLRDRGGDNRGDNRNLRGLSGGVGIDRGGGGAVERNSSPGQASYKTEVSKQSTGPGSSGSGRESPEPSVKRWIPPSLRPQHGLTQNDKNDAIFRKVRGILNKLTPEKFEHLSDDLLKIDLNSPVVLKGIIHLLFEKALDEPKYSCMYAKLCKRLSEEAPNFDSPDKPRTFIRLLLSVCEDKFRNRSKGILYHNNDGPITQEEEEKIHVSKQRMLGNVKFIGELHKLSMLSTEILHKCIQELLDKRNTNTSEQDRCEDMECLCQLIRTCGKNLDTEKGKWLMDQYFEKMDQRSKSQKYPPRIRFMLRDVIELRENNWIPRKVATAEGPVPIRQIRSDDDNIIRTPFINRNRDMRNNERDNDNWMNKFPLNLQPGFNDMFSSLSVTSPPQITSSFGNNNRGYNQRNNQNQNNYNNRFNKNNSQYQMNSHNIPSQYPTSSLNNKDIAPRFKRNLIAANQDTVENLQMRPSANSLLFKASMNIKTPATLPISTPPPLLSNSNNSGGNNNSTVASSINSSLSASSLSTMSSATTSTSVSPATLQQQQQSYQQQQSSNQSSYLRPTPNVTDSSLTANQGGTLSNVSSQNSMKSTSNTIGKSNENSGKDQTPLVTKTGSTEKSTKQGKKDKGPNKDEILKRVLTFLNENLLVNNEECNEKNVDDIVAIFHELKVPDKFLKDAFALILNEIIDKTEEQYQYCIEFLQQLRKDNKQSNALVEAFKIVINKMNEKEATIPRITTLVAILLSRAVNAKLCKLIDISNWTENGQHYPLFLLVLQQLHKILGKDALYDLFTESKINLMKTLPEADRTKDRMANILDDRNLSFLYPLLKLQAEMMKQIQLESNPATFYAWIKRNVDSKYYSDTGFIQALVAVVLKYLTQETLLAEGVEKNPSKPVGDAEQDLILKYSNILGAFLSGRSDLQMIALYSLQVYCHSIDYPKGYLRWWFKNLWETNVIEDDVFLKWKEEINDEYPGKGQALFQVNTWLTWLEQAESEDED